MVFEQASILVDTEFLPPYEDLVDPDAEQFANYLTIHFEDFAREWPQFERLRQLAKVVSIAKWMKDNGIPVDFPWLDSYIGEQISTPDTTPAQTVWSETIVDDLWRGQVGLTGGVDFAYENEYLNDDGIAEAIRFSAIQNRPSGAVFWEFVVANETYNAVAVSLGQTQQSGGLRINHRGYSPSIQTNGDLQVTTLPFYNSFSIDNTNNFGNGWNLIPYTLNFPRPDLLYQEGTGNNAGLNYRIEFQDKITGITHGYSLALDIEDNLVYWPDDPTSSPDLIINQNGTYSIKNSSSQQFTFDGFGQLIEVSDQNENVISFLYEDDKLLELSNINNDNITYIYNNMGYLTEITDALGRKIQYEYDSNGDLIRVIDAKGNPTIYSYNDSHQLIEIVDALNQVVQRITYDDVGRIIMQEDAKGRVTLFEYHDNILIQTDPASNQTIWEFDEQKRLIRETDPLNHHVLYDYGVGNSPTRITNKQGISIYLKYDQLGNITNISNSPFPVLRIRVTAPTPTP